MHKGKTEKNSFDIFLNSSKEDSIGESMVIYFILCLP